MAACSHHNSTKLGQHTLTKQGKQHPMTAREAKQFMRKYNKSLPNAVNHALHYNPMQGIEAPSSKKSNTPHQ